MCNWAKYNYTDSTPVKKCVSNEFKKVKNKDMISYLYGTGTVPIGYPNPMETPLQQEEKEKQEQEEKQELKEEEEQKEKKMELIEFLSEEDINETIEFIETTEKVQYSIEDIENYWNAFKIHSEGIEYPNHFQTMRHFRNWLKRQKRPQKTAWEKHLDVNRKVKEMIQAEEGGKGLMDKHIEVNQILKQKYAREERDKMLGKPGIPLSPI